MYPHFAVPSVTLMGIVTLPLRSSRPNGRGAKGLVFPLILFAPRNFPNSSRYYPVSLSQDDGREVDGLSRRLMGASFALAGMASRRYERIASAGAAIGILEPSPSNVHRDTWSTGTLLTREKG